MEICLDFKKEGRSLISPEEYFRNLLAQTTIALYQFQYYLKGMHNDFHPGNIFIKYCDETIYNGQKLKDIKYFEYNIEGVEYRIPNFGFLVKLGDFGHTNIQTNTSDDTPLMEQITNIVTYQSIIPPKILILLQQSGASFIDFLNNVTNRSLDRNFTSSLTKSISKAASR